MRIGNIIGSLVGLFILPACTNELGNWFPTDINDQGVIVGTQNAPLPGFVGQAVSYRGNGPLVPLKAPDGASVSGAAAIGNDGTIAGSAMVNSGGLTATYWDASGEPHLVPRRAAWGANVPTFATAINGRGVIAGLAGSSVPWVFDIKTAELTELPILDAPQIADATYAFPTAINEAGDVVGYALQDYGLQGSYYRAVRWPAGTHEVEVLPSDADLPGHSLALGINNQGAIVGAQGTVAGFVPVVWEDGAAPRRLPIGSCGSLALETADPFPFGVTAAAAINDSGVIVANILGPQGCATSNTPGPDAGSEPTNHLHAVRWSANGTLSVLSEGQSFVRAINAAGTAVGSKGAVAQRWP